MATTAAHQETKEAVLLCLGWFDLFDCPLAPVELRRSLSVRVTSEELQGALDALLAEQKIAATNGYYHLPGRAEIFVTRQDRYAGAQHKYSRARRVARLFRLIPWIRYIAIGNRMGAHNLKREGDIDLFIVTAPRRLWLTRFLTAGLAALLRLRPTAGDARDKICLSFYVSSDSLDLSRFRLPGGDPYFTHWLAGLMPILDKDGAGERLMAANRWLAHELPNSPLPRCDRGLPSEGRIDSPFEGGEGGDGDARREPTPRPSREGIFSRIERALMRWQVGHFPPAIRGRLNSDTCVVADEHTIKLHVNDRRGEYREKWYKTIQGIVT